MTHGTITIVKLGRGWRVDVLASPPDCAPRLIDRCHFDSERKARAFAALIGKIATFEIVEASRCA